MRWLTLFVFLYCANTAAFAQDIQFKLIRNMLLFPVTVGDQQLTARLDTGGAFSIVHPTTASRLNLRAVGKVQASGLGGKPVTYATMEGITVGIGDLEIKSKPLLAIPLSSMSDDADPKIDITLGRDLVGSLAIEIDFDRSVLRFTPSSQFKPKDNSGRIAIRRVGEDRTIEAEISDWGKVRADFDTGNPGSIEMTTRVAAKALEGQPASQFVATGIDGHFVLTSATLPSLKVGGAEFTGVPVAVRPRANDRIGIGMDILKRFNLIIDLAHDQMWMAPNKGHGAAFRKDGSGIWTDDSAWPRKLLLVSKGSPAETVGLKAGDILAEIRNKAGQIVNDPEYVAIGEALTIVTTDGRRLEIITDDYF